jgi:hypothetical protein
LNGIGRFVVVFIALIRCDSSANPTADIEFILTNHSETGILRALFNQLGFNRGQFTASKKTREADRYPSRP